MGRTRGLLQQDTPNTDLALFIPPSLFTNVGAGTSTLTLNAKGDFSGNVAASQVIQYVCPLAQLMQRLGMAIDSQNQFNSIPDEAGPAGRPPYAGASQLVPRTTNIPKGIQINDLTVHFSILTANLSTHTIGLSKTVMPAVGTPAALTITDILAAGANGLPVAFNANPQSVKVAVASPSFNVTDLSELVIAYDATTGGSGTYRFYGMTLHCSFNLN